MGISTPSPPLLNIEGLRDAPGSIYLSDGRTRICKCTYGIKISISSYKMKTKVEHRTSRAKKQGRPANRQWPPVARERVLQDMLESQSLLWVIFGHVSPCRSLPYPLLPAALFSALLERGDRTTEQPKDAHSAHPTAQECPLSSRPPPLNRSSVCLSQALYFPPDSTVQHICIPLIYITQLTSENIFQMLRFPSQYQFTYRNPRWQNTMVAITIMESIHNTHFYLIPQKWGTQLAFVQWLGDSHILNNILCFSENPQYLGRFE